MSVLHFDCRFHYPTGFQLEFAFDVESGVTALWGPSGSGKTTTLHLIAGLLRPEAGRITLAERILFDSATKRSVPIERRNIGLVFQDHQLFPHYTVEGNLRYGIRPGTSSAANFEHLVEVLELGPLLKRYPATLSGGQRQRTALGRAIVCSPSLLLLDEPVTSLDDELKAEVLTFLLRIHREYQTPLLLVTHDVRHIEALEARPVPMPLVQKKTPTE